MTVIYADSLFVINVLVDYLLLLITGRLAGIPLQRIRYLKSAILGGLCAVISIIPIFYFMNSIPLKLLIWLLISFTAYGASKHFFKLTLLLGINACAFAGIVLVLAFFFQKNNLLKISVFPQITWLLLAGSIVICIFTCRLFQSFMPQKINKTLVRAELSIAGKTSTLVILLDTGNHLRDTVTGHPILIVSSSVLSMILPERLSRVLSSEHLQQPLTIPVLLHQVEPSLFPSLIPYQALGITSGMLPTIRADWIKINETTFAHITVALAPTPLGFGYSALWGGEI